MLGEKLRELRIKEGYSQKELGSKLSTSASTIGMYEQNRRSPGQDMLLKIATVFNVSIDYLLSHSTDEKIEPASKDVTKLLENLKTELMHEEGLMFNGEPATEEAIDSILQAMEIGLSIAKEKNKKYTPKKFL